MVYNIGTTFNMLFIINVLMEIMLNIKNNIYFCNKLYTKYYIYRRIASYYIT